MTWDPGAKDSSSRKVDRQVGPCLRLYQWGQFGFKGIPASLEVQVDYFLVGLFEQAHGFK